MVGEIITLAAAQRLRSYSFGAYLDKFCTHLEELGYTRATIRTKLWSVGYLARWMETRELAVVDLDDRRVDECIAARRRSGRGCRGWRLTMLQLLEVIRSADDTPRPEPICEETPATVLMGSYEAYLRRERALAETTITGYRPFVHEFIAECLGDGFARPSVLGPRNVEEFLLARVRQMAPKRGLLMGSALRSFLRFLFLRAETEVDLALAVPTVRQWRLSTVPRHLPADDVERLLQACDTSSATGRRNHAILLLLARLGLRASEIVSLKLGDLRWREGEIIVRGKGEIHDRLPLLADVGEALTLYLTTDRPTCASRRVFLCMRAPHRGFSHPSSVSTIVARTLARAGIVSPSRGAHLLRHSLATTMVRRGASLTEIGEVLRHRSPNSTEIYAKLDFGSLRDVALPWPVSTGGAS
jgi:site-specific recombinase XerD